MMMSLRSWLSLLLFYSVYLLIGGFAFQALECEEPRGTNGTSFKQLHRTYFAFYYNKIKEQFKVQNNLTYTDCDRWSLYNSVFFSFTAMTTIGFGHLAPETWQGKLFCIFYSLLGVPINGILIGSLGTFFGSKLPKFKRNIPRGNRDIKHIAVLCCQIFGYLIPGFIVFMVIPAVVFWYIEDGWTYLDSLYFAFVALMTIGFGDFVAGRDVNVLNRLGGWKIVYETGLIIWILFGLGYIFMIVSVITDGIKTPARKAVKKLAEAEKVMLARILREIVLKKSKGESHSGSHHGSVFGHNFSEGVIGDVPDYFILPMESAWSSKAVSCTGDFHHHQQQQQQINQHLHKKSGMSLNVESEEQAAAVTIDNTDADQDGLEDLIESVNHDTITSLHDFMQAAKIVHRSLHALASGGTHLEGNSDDDVTAAHEASNINLSPEPNLAEASSVRSRSSSASKVRNPFKKRKISDKSCETAFSGVYHAAARKTQSAWTHMKSPNSQSDEVLGRSISSHVLGGHIGHRHKSLAEVLRTTTLEEFFEAVEKIQADDEQLMHDISVNSEESPSRQVHRRRHSETGHVRKFSLGPSSTPKPSSVCDIDDLTNQQEKNI